MNTDNTPRRVPGEGEADEAPRKGIWHKLVRQIGSFAFGPLTSSAPTVQSCERFGHISSGRRLTPPPAYCGSNGLRRGPGLINIPFSIFLTTCFSGIGSGFACAGRGGNREKAGDGRLLPSAVILSGQRRRPARGRLPERHRPEPRCRSRSHRPDWRRRRCSGTPSCASIRRPPSRRSRTEQYSSRSACPHRR